MKKLQNLTEAFEASIHSGMVTGSLKFPNLYCSQLQIFDAAQKWAEEEEGLIYASVRTDGDSFIALDFRFDEKKQIEKKYNSFLYDYLKPRFQKELGEDYIQAWSISRESVIVK
jgi:hypothetical protein